MKYSLLFFTTLLISCFSSEKATNNEYLESIEKAQTLKSLLEEFHVELDPPKPGEWLDQHHEYGQTFDQYTNSRPVRPTNQRDKIYVQKLGKLDSSEQKIIELTAEYLSLFYQMEVRVLESIPLDTINIPNGSQRFLNGYQQYHTKYILYDILKPNLPDSAAAYVAFTSEDLYPNPNWNYVFGQASVKDRVGVWSIHRYGDPSAGIEAFNSVLMRAMKVATHETGHMFSMRHCKEYKCNMNGSNDLSESDQKPPYLCHECLAKMKWILNFSPQKRFKEINDFFNQHKLNPTYRQYYEAVLHKLDSCNFSM